MNMQISEELLKLLKALDTKYAHVPASADATCDILLQDLDKGVPTIFMSHQLIHVAMMAQLGLQFYQEYKRCTGS